MLHLISADLDRLQDDWQFAVRSAQTVCAPELVLPQPLRLRGNVVAIAIDQTPTLDLSFPAGPRFLTAAEAQMVERAFWSSVTIIDEGQEA